MVKTALLLAGTATWRVPAGSCGMGGLRADGAGGHSRYPAGTFPRSRRQRHADPGRQARRRTGTCQTPTVTGSARFTGTSLC